MILYHPRVMEKNQPECFIDGQRPCGPACIAFSDPPPGPDYEGKQWANCMVLVNLHRTGKHLAVLTQVISSDSADRKRTGQKPPPVPR